MAKKRAKKVSAIQAERAVRPVRLDLSEADHRRLERCAREMGLNKSSFARMAVLKLIKEMEGKA